MTTGANCLYCDANSLQGIDAEGYIAASMGEFSQDLSLSGDTVS